jgi:hypothetical protein
MAGFAIVMTALMYGFVGLIIAGIGAIGFYLYARKRRSRQVAFCCAASPFLALLWLLVAFLLHVQISNRLAHQDCGFSPDPYVTLPNGYVLGSHNTYDGYFHAPGFETDVPVTGPGYVRSLIDLELSEGKFTGTQFNFKTGRVRPFVFDTATRSFSTPDRDESTGKECNSSNQYCLDSFEQIQTSVHEDGNSYWKLYFQYRHRWPNYVLLLLIVFGEGAVALAVRRLWQRSAVGQGLPEKSPFR